MKSPHSNPKHKMPGHNVTRQKKRGGRYSEAAKLKSATKVSVFFEGGVEARLMIPAKIVKNSGQNFQLAYHDGKAMDESVLLGEPCGTFGSKGKIRLKFSAGDVVIVEGLKEDIASAKARKKKIILDIVGKLSKREAQIARARGLIPDILIAGADEDTGGIEFDYSDEESGLESEEEDEIVANVKRGKVIRARKVLSKAEKTTGRGSGGAAGRSGDGSVRANERTREELEALRYASTDVAREQAADYEPDNDELSHSYKNDYAYQSALPTGELEAMADAMGAGAGADKKPAKEAAAAAAPAPAPAPAAEPDGFDLYSGMEKEEADVALESFENWEDGCEATPAPPAAAPTPKAKKKVQFRDDNEIDIDAI